MTYAFCCEAFAIFIYNLHKSYEDNVSVEPHLGTSVGSFNTLGLMLD